MRVLVVAPHPDDETLGCGGTLLRHKNEGDMIYWNIVTSAGKDFGWSKENIKKREKEITDVCKYYEFNKIFNFKLPTTKIDTIPIATIAKKFSALYNEIEPEIIYIPFAKDVHSDHQIITSVIIQSTLKWFRYPSIKKF